MCTSRLNRAAAGGPPGTKARAPPRWGNTRPGVWKAQQGAREWSQADARASRAEPQPRCRRRVFGGAHRRTTTRGRPRDEPRSGLLPAGADGVSTAGLGATLPKGVDGENRLGVLADGDYTNHQLIELLNDQEKPADERLPKRGVPIERERHLASCFISDSQYGTRASTVVRMGRKEIYFAEQTYLPEGVPGPKVEFEFAVETVDASAEG